MTKRLVKRHKRQVARAKENIKLSEPDVRTPEQIKAARELSRPAGGWRSGPKALHSSNSVRTQAGPSGDSRGKADG